VQAGSAQALSLGVCYKPLRGLLNANSTLDRKAFAACLTLASSVQTGLACLAGKKNSQTTCVFKFFAL
jgi:hypothetical protein